MRKPVVPKKCIEPGCNLCNTILFVYDDFDRLTPECFARIRGKQGRQKNPGVLPEKDKIMETK